MVSYYVEEVHKKTATSAMQRKKQTEPLTALKLLPRMSKAIFQQDGTLPHNAISTQDWYRDNLPGF